MPPTFIKRMPFFRFLVAIIPGILLSYYLNCSDVSAFIIISLLSLCGFAVCLFISSLRQNYKLRWASGVFMFLFLFSMGWIITKHSFPSRISGTYSVVAQGRIERTENRMGEWLRIVFSPQKINNDSLPFKSKDLWMLMIRNDFGDNMPEAGQQIIIKGELNGLSKPDNPEAFDYDAYLFRNKIAGQMFLNDNNLIIQDVEIKFRLVDYAEKIRTYCIDLFVDHGIENSQLGILSALILGERDGIDRELNDRFVRSGAVHMLAVSGLHVGIIYMFINYILTIFFRPTHPARAVISVILLFGYASITGFSPSVTRAVVMFSFIQVGRTMAKNTNTYNNLCASAFLLLIVNPMFLFNIGFWLSHLAVASIVAFTYDFEKILKWTFMPIKKVWSLISVSTAAQLGVFPILLYLFGAFPIYFLIANILVLPLVAPVIILGIVLLAISWMPFLPEIVTWILNFLLKTIEFSVTKVVALPNSYIEGIWISFPMVVILYILVILLYNIKDYYSARKLINIGIVLILIILILNIQFFIKKSTTKLVVFSAGNNALIEMVENGESVVFATQELSIRNRDYAAGMFERKNVVRQKEFFIINDSTDRITPASFRITADTTNILLVTEGRSNILNDNVETNHIIILAGRTDIDVRELVAATNCETIVFASNCPTWLTSKWNSELENSEIKIHDVRKDGAFIWDK